MMKAVSLFAGIGGFDLALERNGVEVVATCEIDKHAQKILTRHFPKAQLFDDVSTLTGEDLFNAGFDSSGIIVGGFPCQDVSVAGKRAGLTNADGTHTRSGLFWEVIRLLEETQAATFILENVPGLLSSNNGRDFAVILNALQECGYIDISWRILDAQFFGVPQRRRRVFIVGRRAGTLGRTSAEILALTESRAGYLAASEQKGKATAGDAKEGTRATWWNGGNITDSITTTSNEQRMPDKGRLQAVIVPFTPFAFDGYNQTISDTSQTIRAGKSDGDHIGMVVQPFTPSSFAQYQEGVGTLRSNGGDLGGQRDIVGALQARDYKGVGNQYVAENKLVY